MQLRLICPLAGFDRCNDRIVLPAVPDLQHHLDELGRALVTVAMFRVSAVGEVGRGGRAASGDDVPTGATATEMIERCEASSEIPRRAVRGRRCRKQSNVLRHWNESSEQIDRVVAGLSHVPGPECSNAWRIGEEDRVEDAAFSHLRNVDEMVEAEQSPIAVGGKLPGRLVVPVSRNEQVQQHMTVHVVKPAGPFRGSDRLIDTGVPMLADDGVTRLRWVADAPLVSKNHSARHAPRRLRRSTMQGHADIIELLNDVLTAELTAINEYFVDAKMFQNWGFKRLASQFREESIDEMKDADTLIERILFLDGVPNLQRLGTIRVGETPLEKLQLALQLEVEAVARLNNGIARCVELGDNGSRELLENILEGEEDHADWLEAQLELIRQIGDSAYLAQQIHD